MKPLVLSLLILAAAPMPLLRQSNSEKLTREGIAAFEEKQNSAAARLFASAAEIAASSRAWFNLGTALVENGEPEPGEAALAKASEEGGAVAADAYFNRGNLALGAEQLEEAIELYSESLRLEPSMADAKRNLEIALRKKEEQEQQQEQQNQQQEGEGEEQPQPQPESGEEPSEGEDSSPPNDPGGEESSEQMTPEEILRSIAQQEREELSRMRRGKTEGKRPVGW